MEMYDEGGQVSVIDKIREILEANVEERRNAALDQGEMPPTPPSVWLIEHLADYFTESDPKMIFGDEVYSDEIFKILVLNMYDFALYVDKAEAHSQYRVE